MLRRRRYWCHRKDPTDKHQDLCAEGLHRDLNHLSREVASPAPSIPVNTQPAIIEVSFMRDAALRSHPG
jgi:hypothetical protein